MALKFNLATEQRVRRMAELGPFHQPDQVVNRALDLLESQEIWIARNRDAIRERLEHSWAQAERGELYTPEKAFASSTRTGSPEPAKILIHLAYGRRFGGAGGEAGFSPR